MNLFVGDRAVLDAFRHDEKFTRFKVNVPFAELDRQAALQDEEEIVGVFVLVPDEGPLSFTTMRSCPLNVPTVRGL